MAHAVNAVGDFFKAIYELFAGFFTTLFNLINAIVTTIVTFFADIFHLILSTIQGTFNVAGETAKFLLGKLMFQIDMRAHAD
jgi:phage-related protein